MFLIYGTKVYKFELFFINLLECIYKYFCTYVLYNMYTDFLIDS